MKGVLIGHSHANLRQIETNRDYKMNALSSIKRALLSVSDKTGVIDLAKGLADMGVELISTGGSAATLRNAGLSVTDVSRLTNFPEMMGGRVKTLHPNVHGGLLARRDLPDHIAAMDAHNIAPIDLLVVNLYPFEETIAKGADYDTCIENIDIGGPAMIRAAAKNHRDVTVIVDVVDYDRLLAQMSENNGATDIAFRQELAQIAYARTAAYDTAVSNWLAEETKQRHPRRKLIAGEFTQELRYGENPHQTAAFYRSTETRNGVANATQIQGKALSYNNINDTDAAFELVAEFDPKDGHACAIIKHANPCGVARAGTQHEAYKRAFDCDRTSAFGGIIAFNQPLDGKTANEISRIFTEVVIAPGADADAQAVFAEKPNLRLLLTAGLPDVTQSGQFWRHVSGGYLIQNRDNGMRTIDDLRVVTKRQPSTTEMEDLLFAWKIAKHVKSNAIIYAKNLASVGIGAGQMSRIDSTRIATRKAQDMADILNLPDPLTQGAVVASDAFFPFSDGLIAAAEAGATAIIQPGGAMRDQEVIAAADERNLAMVFTDMRHFRH